MRRVHTEQTSSLSRSSSPGPGPLRCPSVVVAIEKPATSEAACGDGERVTAKASKESNRPLWGSAGPKTYSCSFVQKSVSDQRTGVSSKRLSDVSLNKG